MIKIKELKIEDLIEYLNNAHEQREIDKLHNAVTVVLDRIKDDPKYYKVWEASISKGFKETLKNYFNIEDSTLNQISTEGAINFLKNLIMSHEETK